MPAQCALTSSIVTLLVLLGTAGAGPFSPRSNVTLPAPRPPPQPGGPSSQLYEHTVEGGEKQVVFTHRINLPPSAGCGCPPGTEPPVPASEVQALRVRLEILEELVKGLKEHCSGGCCPPTAQAGTGQTDVRSLCSLHGVFDLSRCACSCEPGWGGPTCSDPTDTKMPTSSPASAPRTCPDDCNDQGRCVRGRCVCFPGYSGPSCSWPSCPGDCQGRGRCVQGVCVCRAGFSGPDCSQRSCPRNCNQRGRCEEGRCVCDPGYSGEDCGVRSCPRACSQKGRCENGRCVCNPGYSGEDCGVRNCPRGCSQRGRCEDGRCVCDPGYSGEDCGVRSCPWDCGEGGRCVDGRCVCWPGYSGEDCSTRTCPRDCRGRGRCEDGECICDAGYSGDDCGVRSCPGDCNQRGHCEDGRCVCWPGYTGADCSARACPRDCRGRGRCEDGVCVCHAGYSGEDCGVRSCPGDCRGRGSCENGRCVCWPGYTGRDCGTRACPGDCRGRGRCVDGRCVCNLGFAGEDCGSRRCPGDCRGHGHCEDGVCVCDTGYSGDDCSTRSCPSGCRGRGRCLDGLCVCDDGYTGEDCGVRRCPRDCSQQGVCQDGLCVCHAGYAGEDCSIRTCPADCNRRGRCDDGRCVCDPGYTGPACATRTCPADCRGRGRCVQGVCLCYAGYGGEDCGQEEPPASACPGGCGPRELCRAGQCVCVEGFRGPDCAIQTCPGDCRGRGECLQGRCVCQDGYAGDDCGEEIPAIQNMRMHLLEETTVRTEWTRAPGPVDAYEIQFIPTTEGASPPFTARVPSSASAYDQRGLAPGQDYQVTVRALRGTSWGPPASKTITTMIDGPQDLRVVAVTPTTLDLSWLRPQAEVDRFVVSYVSAGNQRVRLEVPPEADRTQLTDLMPGVEYVVTVTAERGRAVSYPASIRANTAPGHYGYAEVHPPVPPPSPRPRPRPRPPRPSRPLRPTEGSPKEWHPRPSLPQPPRRPWGNLTAELGRFRGTVQDLERHLRAHGYPLRANQTYTSVARQIHEFLKRHQTAGAPASKPRPSHPTASPTQSTRKRESDQGDVGPASDGAHLVNTARHPKPEVLGSAADGALIVSLDGLRGQFERVVLRWRPLPPAKGPSGELTVDGSERTVRLPNLRPGTTYHVEVHGVRAGQTSKSYAFITTTGSLPFGLSEATDEPPPSGPSTTQGAQAPILILEHHPLGELKVLGRDKTGRLRVAWTAQPDTFAHFQLRMQVAEGPWAHEELLPGDVHQALVPLPPPGAPYNLLLHGITPGGKPSVPITYQGIMDKAEEQPEKPTDPPRLGELTVTGLTSDSLLLHWTVPKGEFDSFVIQYKDKDGPQVIPVEGPQRSAPVTSLEPGRKYRFILYGLVGKKRHGPLVAEAKILPQSDPDPGSPPRLGELWVTDPTPDSLHLSWTVPEGQFDSFMVQYRDKGKRPLVVPVEGPERSVVISPLDPNHKYRFTLFGIANKKRYGPLTADGTTAPQKEEESSEKPLLGELTVTGVTPDSLRLSWTVAQGPFDSFVIQYKDAQGQPQTVPIAGDENEVTVPGLESNRKYKMNLYGLRGRQRVGPVSVVAKTAPPHTVDQPLSPSEPSTEAPEALQKPRLGELTVTGSSPDSLSLSWTVPEGQFDHFLVQYRNGDGQPKVVRVPGHEDQVTISGLEPDHKYKMNLYGVYSGQRVGPMSVVGVTAAEEDTSSPTEPSTEAPEPPEEPLLGQLTVTGSSPDSLSLSWTVPQGDFDSFTVQYKDSDGRPQVVRVGGQEREAIVRDLEPGHKYKMNLYGLHDGQRVGPVSTVGVTDSQPEEIPPAIEPPVEPRLEELTVTGVTPNSVSLSWMVPEGQFDSFMVQYKDRDGQPQEVPVAADQHEVTVLDLDPARKYKMNVYGLHGGRRVGPLSVLAMTDPLPPTPAPATEAPKLPLEPRLGELTVTEVTPDSVGLLWTVPEGEFDSFMVQYKDRDGQPQVVPVAADQREVTIPGLESSRKYKFLLFGIRDGRRRSQVSVEAKTGARDDASPGPLPRLGELWVTDPTTDSLRLSWTVPEGHFDSFMVQFKDKGGPQVVPVEGQELTATITALDAGRKYRFLLYGLQGKKRFGPLTTEGTTEPMNTVDHTRVKPPPKPRLGEELRVTSVTQDSVDLSWTVSEGQFDSFVIQYKDRDGQSQVVPVEGSHREVRVSGLDPGRRYKLLLYGLRESKRVGPLSVIAMTGPRETTEAWTEVPTTSTPAAVPHLGELRVEEATPHSLHLSWVVTEGEFNSFEIQYTDRDGQLKVVSTEGDQSDITLTGLESDHRYLVNLYGFHDGQRVGPAQIEALTVPWAEEPTEPPTMTPKPKPHLGELTVTDTAPNSLSLSWTVPEGQFDHFLIQYRNGDGQPKVVRVPGNEDQVTISGLEPDHKYKMNLYGIHSGQRVGPVSTVGVTAAEEDTPSPTEPSTEAPEPPEEPLLGQLTVTGSSPDSLSLSWTVPQGDFDSFTVQYKDSDGRPQVVRVGGQEREAIVRDLEPGRKYKMNLYGLHEGQRVGPVSTVGMTDPEEESTDTPPLKPRLGELTVTDATPDSLSLSWTVPEGQFDHFLVQYRNGDGQPKVVRVPGHEDQVTIPGLEPDHKYKMNLYGVYSGQRVGPMSVVGVTAAEEETPSPTEPSTEAPEPPEEPLLGQLTVTGSSPDSLSLSWTVPQGDFDSFTVQYKDSDGRPQVVRVGGQEREAIVRDLEPGRKYKMNLYGLHEGQRVGPVSTVGVTDPEEVTMPTEAVPIMTSEPPPEKPRLGELTVTDATPDSLRLSWTIPEGQFDQFVIQYKNGDGKPKVVRVPGHEDQVTIPGLEPDHKYKMNLYGIHSGQRVGPVSVVGVTTAEEDTSSPTEPSTEAPEPPEEPLLGELTVTGSSPDSLSLSWTVPQGDFDSFTVQYKDSDGRPQVVRVGGQEREAIVRDLEPGRKYKMNLYGLHEGQRVGPVSVVGVTTAEEETPSPTEPSTEAPEPPEEPLLGELTVTGSSPDSLSLSWTVPQGDFDSFTVQYKDSDGRPQVVRVGGQEREAIVRDLEPGRKYKMNLYGLHDGQRVGPVSTVGVTDPEEEAMTTQVVPTTTPKKPILGELTVTDATPDSLSLSWTIPEGQFDQFVIQYKNGDGKPKVVRVPGHEDQVTIPGLEPDHKYKMNLYGIHSGQRVGPVSVVGVTTAEEETPSPIGPSTEAPEPPEEPLLGDLTVTGSSPDSLSLSWTVPQGDFDSFTVQYKDSDGRPQVVRVGGQEREAIVRDLEPGHKYKMNLYGLHEGQRVGPVSVVGVTTAEEETPSPTEPSTEAPEPPEEPLLGELTVTGSSPDSLSLSWTVPQGDFDSFTVQYKDSDGRPQVVRVGGQEREAIVRDLEPGRKYKMNLYGLHEGQRVGPVSTVGVTAPEEEAMTTQVVPTTTPEPPPEKPRLGELTVTDATPDSLSLSWTIPEGQFDHFLVQYRNGDGQPKVVRVPGHEDQVTISGLEPDHKYKMNLYGIHSGQRVGPVSVVGVTAAEEETPSPTEPSTEAPEPPEEPLLGELTVTGSSPDSLSLSWTVPKGDFDSFTVQYKDSDGRPQVVRVGGQEREAIVRDLEPGRKYKMNLYGLHDGQRVGPVSTVGVTAPLPTEPPIEPRLGDLAVVEVTSSTVHLSWTVAQGPFDSFLVQYKDAQGQPQTVPVTRDLSEVTISGLDPARKYKFLLFGLQGGKRHGPVSVDVKTDTKLLPRLGELTMTEVTQNSVGLSWTVPEGEFDSFLVQYKDRGGQLQAVPVAADQREVTIPNLEPNRKYKFLLYGLLGRKRLGSASVEGTTAPLEKTPQPRLGELTVTGETADSLHLLWTVAQGPFDSFLVQYRDSDGQPQTVLVAADQNEVTIEGLQPHRKYKFLLYGLSGGKRLGPVSALGMTAPEEDTSAPSPTELPEAPLLGTMTVTEATPDSLRLSWGVARGPFDSFVVQYQDTEGQPQALLVDGDQDKVLISGLEPSTSYKFFLYGLREGIRHGPVSAEGVTGPVPAGQTPGDPGPRLSQLSVTDVTTSSLRLNWEAPLGAFDSFLLRFGVPSPSTLEPRPRPLLQRELMVPGARRTAVLRDLRPGTMYSLTLYGLRGPHKADSIQGTARTLSPVLESPRDLQFSDIGETSARANWVPPSSRVDSFKISYQLADGGEPQSVLVDGRTQTQILQGLIPDTRYEVTVVSVRGFEESEPLTGLLTTVSDGPTQLRALNLTDGSALLHWKPPHKPVDKYNVQVASPGAPPLQGSAPGSAVDYPLTDLALDTNYTATVRGLRGPNFTSPASITFTTGLKAPQDLEAKEVTPRTALLTWAKPEVPPTGYLLSYDTPGGQIQEILLPAGTTSHRLLRLFPSTLYNAQLRAVWGESLTPPVSTSFTTGGLRIPFPRDCGEEMQNGASSSKTTTIFLNGNRERPLDVFCDMETDGGGWLVFQRRMDGQTDFWRDWEEYAHGFGNISREFWLGNEVLHSLTQAGDYSMRVDLRAGNEAVFAQYDFFRVDSAMENYRLHLEGYHGTAGDSMSYHSGSVFSARDRDPNNLLISCAVSYRGAWWYRNCHYANLNGLYGSTVDHQGVSWYHWKGFEFSVPFTEMKLRPRNFQAPTRGS